MSKMFQASNCPLLIFWHGHLLCPLLSITQLCRYVLTAPQHPAAPAKRGPILTWHAWPEENWKDQDLKRENEKKTNGTNALRYPVDGRPSLQDRGGIQGPKPFVFGICNDVPVGIWSALQIFMIWPLKTWDHITMSVGEALQP